METDEQQTWRNSAKAVAWTILSILVIIWIFSPNPKPGAVALHTASGGKRIPVYYWHMWSGEWQPVMDHVCDEFNASQTKYEVIPLQVPPAEGDQKFLLSVAGGDPPDVMTQWTPAISTWAQAGVLQPLDTRMSPTEHNYFMKQTFPVEHENGWYKGHLYGLLVNFDVYACYYRPDEFTAAGLDPNKFPSTLESLMVESRMLNKYEPGGRLARIGFLPSALTDYVGSFGGGFYDSRTGKVLIDTPQNLAAMQFIVDADKKIGFDQLLRFNAGLNSQDGANWPFISGQLAITLDGEWRVKQLAEYAPNLRYDVAPLPPPVGGVADSSYSASSYLTIPAGAKHADGAWAFIKFWEGLDDPNTGAKFKTWFSWLPDSQKMADSPNYQAYLNKYPQYRAFVTLAASPHIITLPPVPYSVYLQDHIISDDLLAETGALNAPQALTLLNKQIAVEEAQRKALGYDQ